MIVPGASCQKNPSAKAENVIARYVPEDTGESLSGDRAGSAFCKSERAIAKTQETQTKSCMNDWGIGFALPHRFCPWCPSVSTAELCCDLSCV